MMKKLENCNSFCSTSILIDTNVQTQFHFIYSVINWLCNDVNKKKLFGTLICVTLFYTLLLGAQNKMLTNVQQNEIFKNEHYFNNDYRNSFGKAFRQWACIKLQSKNQITREKKADVLDMRSD